MPIKEVSTKGSHFQCLVIRPFHIHVFVNMSDCNILFITEIIKFNLKIRQSKLRAAEPKDETPGGVPFNIDES